MKDLIGALSGMSDYHNKPCAAHGLTSYRYYGRYGWIMIGANSAREALSEALRSTTGPADLSLLQVWDVLEGTYKPVDQ